MRCRKILKILIIYLILLMIFMIVPKNVLADDYGDPNQFEVYEPEGKWIRVSNAINNASAVILTSVRMFATGIGIVMLIFIGIKYVSAPPEMKAEIKKHKLPEYVIGAVILFGASGILTLITYFINDVL